MMFYLRPLSPPDTWETVAQYVLYNFLSFFPLALSNWKRHHHCSITIEKFKVDVGLHQ